MLSFLVGSGAFSPLPYGTPVESFLNASLMRGNLVGARAAGLTTLASEITCLIDAGRLFCSSRSSSSLRVTRLETFYLPRVRARAFREPIIPQRDVRAPSFSGVTVLRRVAAPPRSSSSGVPA